MTGINAEIQRIFIYLNSASSFYPKVATAINQINLQIGLPAAKIKPQSTIAEKEAQNSTKQKY
ncbi:hypothetical protein [Alistipes sp. ZOR0009]|uniref:hypothetical protein n=1 Tax=Alistipes sp. ZOR0009 TaxID=1339253 RepID=UPI000645A035|nr:hypothetical protein [Alistipes sp. ZOR0009]